MRKGAVNEAGSNTGELPEITDKMHLVEIPALISDVGPAYGRVFFPKTVGAGKACQSRKELGRQADPFLAFPFKLAEAETGQSCHLVDGKVAIDPLQFLHGAVKRQGRPDLLEPVQQESFDDIAYPVKIRSIAQPFVHYSYFRTHELLRVKAVIINFGHWYSQQAEESAGMKTHRYGLMTFSHYQVDAGHLGSYHHGGCLLLEFLPALFLHFHQVVDVKKQAVLGGGRVGTGTSPLFLGNQRMHNPDGAYEFPQSGMGYVVTGNQVFVFTKSTKT